MRFATSRGKPAPIYARGNIKTTRCKTHRRNNSGTKRPQPHPSHTRGTFHRRLQPLYTEKHEVSCSGFLLNTKPMQHSCSHYNAFRSIPWQTRTYLRTWQHQIMMTMKQPFQCNLQPEIQEPHRTTHTDTTTRCKTHRRNNSRTKRPQPHPSHRRGFIVGCSHFTRKNTRFGAPASSPKQSPCNIHAAIPMRSATTASRTA